MIERVRLGLNHVELRNNDFLFTAANIISHLNILLKVFKRLRKYIIKVEAGKCKVHAAEKGLYGVLDRS